MFNTSENIKSVHFIIEGISFPVAIFSSNDWETTQIKYLEKNIKEGVPFTTYYVCKWCFDHHINYQIMYPMKKLNILKNPRKYIAFLKLKKKLAKM